MFFLRLQQNQGLLLKEQKAEESAHCLVLTSACTVKVKRKLLPLAKLRKKTCSI
jgi:hypothetical protein